jgi:hypothetical protein
MATIEFNGTGGLMEGDFGTNDIEVNLDFALNFPGVDEYITVADHADLDFGTGDFTITAWAYADHSGSQKLIVSKQDSNADNNAGYLMRTGANAAFTARVSNGSGYITGTDGDNITPGWHHFAMVVNQSTNRLYRYVDGELQGTATTITASYNTDNNEALQIGRRYDSGGDGSETGLYFDGRIADVRVYKGEAVSQDNIRILASRININSALGPGTTNLKAHWQLNESTIDDLDADHVPDNHSARHGRAQGWDNDAAVAASRDYDAFSVDVQDNSTTTDGTFTVTQGKVECLTMNSVKLDGSGDYVHAADTFMDNAITDDLTLSLWFNTTGTSNDMVIWSRGDSWETCNWILHMDGRSANGNGNMVFQTKDGVTLSSTNNGWNDGEWHHATVVYTFDGTKYLYVDGVLEGSVGDSSSHNASEAAHNESLFFGSRGTGNYIAGKIKDVKLFKDVALSAAQVSSLYSGTYNVTPYHWWKIDDVWGQATVADTGTGTAADGTATGNASVGGASHTHTLDLDGTLTIAANGTLSAPRGNLTLASFFGNSGTYTHNNGTVVTDGASTWVNSAASVDPVFYNLQQSSGQLRFYNNITIERQFQIDAGATHFYIWANKTLTMGTTTNPEANYPKLINNMNTGDKQFWFYAGDGETATLQGVSELYPIIFTDTNGSDIEWGYHANAAAQIKNIDFQFDITTDASDTTDRIKLTGDCEFDAVTVSSGDRLDINGCRAEFSGTLDVNGTIYNTAGSSSVKGQIWGNAIQTQGSNNAAHCDLISDGGYFDADQSTYNTIFMRSGTHTIGGTRTWYTSPLIVGGTTNFNSTNTWGDITVTAGGTFDGNDEIINCGGDFTTSGGLLGPSCLELNGSDEYAATAVYNDDRSLGDSQDYTIELWFRRTSTSGNETLFDFAHWNSGTSVYTGQSRTSAYMDGDGIIYWDTRTGGGTLCSRPQSSSGFDDSKWHHAAFVHKGNGGAHTGTYSTGAKEIWIDGKLETRILGGDTTTDAGGSVAGSMGYDQNKTMAFQFGRNVVSSIGSFFTGQIDEVRLWSDARTKGEIRENMFTEVAATADHLRHQWSFNEGTGTTNAALDTATDAEGEAHFAAPATPSASGAWAGAGAFTPGTSTLKMTGADKALNYLSGETLWHLDIANTSGTVTANVLTGTNNLSIESLVIGSSSSFTAPNGTLTVTGEDAAGNYAIDVAADGTFHHSSGSVNITHNNNTIIRGLDGDDVTGTGSNALNNLQITMGSSATTCHFLRIAGTANRIRGNLTVAEGIFQTNVNSDSFTVDGNVEVHAGGTLGHADHDGADSFGSLLIDAGGTCIASEGTTTITGKNSSNYIIQMGGLFTHNSGTVYIDTSVTGDKLLDLIPSSGVGLNHLKINEDGSGVVQYNGNTTIAGDLTIEEGTMHGYDYNSSELTVEGDVSIESGGTLGAANQKLNCTFGSLTIASGGTHVATSGTTTITAENLDASVGSGAGFAWDNLGTFTHNNGKVVIDTAGNNHTLVKETTFYDLEVNMTNNTREAKFRPTSGTHSEILNNFTLTQGIYEMHVDGDTLDIHGLTTIEANGSFLKDAEHTGLVTHHGLVTNRGAYMLKDGITVKMNGGIRQLNAFTTP